MGYEYSEEELSRQLEYLKSENISKVDEELLFNPRFNEVLNAAIISVAVYTKVQYCNFIVSDDGKSIKVSSSGRYTNFEGVAYGQKKVGTSIEIKLGKADEMIVLRSSGHHSLEQEDYSNSHCKDVDVDYMFKVYDKDGIEMLTTRYSDVFKDFTGTLGINELIDYNNPFKEAGDHGISYENPILPNPARYYDDNASAYCCYRNYNNLGMIMTCERKKIPRSKSEKSQYSMNGLYSDYDLEQKNCIYSNERYIANLVPSQIYCEYDEKKRDYVIVGGKFSSYGEIFDFLKAGFDKKVNEEFHLSSNQQTNDALASYASSAKTL